jgi:hypothetical protein
VSSPSIGVTDGHHCFQFHIAQERRKHPAKAVMGKSSGGSGGDLA